MRAPGIFQRRGAALLLSTGALLAIAGAAEAQDIEATAHVMGRALPQGYYERIREQPDFFELPQGEGWAAPAERAASDGRVLKGTIPLVVIQALFADSPEPAIRTAEIQRVLFDGPAPRGTLTKFYSELSRGNLNVTGRVLPWVRTGVTRAEVVGSNYGLGRDARTGEFLLQAAAAADEEVDFGQFDNDGPDGVPNSGDDDGVVDAAVFQFLEVAASCGGPGIWPHRAGIAAWTGGHPFSTKDLRPDGTPIVINGYITQSTVTCNGTDVQSASVIAHEFGHVLGLPDLYHPAGGIEPEHRRWVVGCWSLMAAGSWGCGDPRSRTEDFGPTLMGPWERIRFGWTEEVVVRAGLGQTIELPSVGGGGPVLRIPLTSPDNAVSREYLLVEYRTREGFDASLPAGGVLVYHVDETLPLRPCPTCERKYMIKLVEADGNEALLKNAGEGGNRGEPGDAFGVNGPASLTPVTTPSTRRNSGEESGVSLYRIELDGAVARIHLSSGAISRSRLTAPFTGAPPDAALTSEEKAYLDSVGNRNGRYDVGDLRAYLLQHPEAATP